MRIEVFPTFSVYIQLQELYAIELARGCYQVRLNFKPSALFDCQLSQCFSSSIDDLSSVENLTGVSRTINVVTRDHCYKLDSAFRCRANCTKRIDQCDSMIVFPVQLELHYLNADLSSSAGSGNGFRLVSKRQLNICLRADQSVHCHRPVFFEFFAFSMVSLTVHASLIAGRTMIRKTSLDIPISNKLRNYHARVCREFVATLTSLQAFIQRYSHLITSPIISSIDCREETRRLSEELEASDTPWLTLKQHVEALSHRLSAFFGQFLQLFAKSKDLCAALLREFDQQRLRQMSEAFLFSEETAQLLLTPTVNQTANVLELVKKSDYLDAVPQLPVYVDDFDVNVDDFTIILEQRFLPTSSSSTVTAKRLSVATTGGEGRAPTMRCIGRRRWPALNFMDMSCSPSASLSVKEDSLTDFWNGRKGKGDVMAVEFLTSNHNDKLKKLAPAICESTATAAAVKSVLKSRKLFQFCLSIGGHKRGSKSDALLDDDGPFLISPNSLLLKGGNFQRSSAKELESNFGPRQMTDPSTGIGLPDETTTRNNKTNGEKVYHLDSGKSDADRSSKAHSIFELSVKVDDSDKQAKDGKQHESSNRTSIDQFSKKNDVLENRAESSTPRRPDAIECGVITSHDGLSFDRAVSTGDDLVEFVRRKELFKLRLQTQKQQYYLYSETMRLDQDHRLLTLFSCNAQSFMERRRQRPASADNVHLVVFVHGLEGSSEDLSAYRNYLRTTLPNSNLEFLLSAENQSDTWLDFGKMAEKLMDEIHRFIWIMPYKPSRISFVAHSLGGIIVRTLCDHPKMNSLLDKLYTFMTLSSPHCGLLFNQRTTSWGISILKWWKQSACLEQLTMRDSPNVRETFLYRLSMNAAFGMFQHVLLVGSMQDVYVPGHSALVQPCKASLNSDSELAAAYTEMVANIHERIVASPRRPTLIKYTVAHAMANVSRAQQVTGRAVHIASVDDDTFVEKLIGVSAFKYFR